MTTNNPFDGQCGFSLWEYFRVWEHLYNWPNPYPTHILAHALGLFKFSSFVFGSVTSLCPVSWSVGLSVCDKFLKEKEVTLPCSYQSTCLICWLQRFGIALYQGTRTQPGSNLPRHGSSLSGLRADKTDHQKSMKKILNLRWEPNFHIFDPRGGGGGGHQILY